jgi:ABC-type glycerol-3-phosphate transport system permease component
MRTRADRKDLLLDAVTVAAMLLMLAPIIWVFLGSIKPEPDIMSGNPWPTRVTIDHYVAIWNKEGFLRALGNSLTVGVVVAIVTTLLAAPAAYSLSRFTYRGRDAISLLILGTQTLPAVAVLVPLVVIVRQLGLTNTLTALIFIHLALGLPIAVWMLKGYIDAIPRDLEEAATVDGCGRFGAMVRIVLPLVRPALVAVGTFSFVLSWGEFVIALAVVSKAEVRTLPLALQSLFDPYQFSWGQVMAGGVVIALPAVLLFFIFRNQLVGGLLAGGIKG